MQDDLVIGDVSFRCRFFLGSGKTSRYTEQLIRSAVRDAGTEMISVSIRNMYAPKESGLQYIPKGIRILPNTLGARNAEDAVSMAHEARKAGYGNFIKVEILHDTEFLLPDNEETLKATRELTAEGFVVLPYFYPDLMSAEEFVQAGAAAIMPLASPGGSSKGLQTRDFIEDMIGKIPVPIIVDAGIGHPSQACEAMEMGCDGVMANTALATAENLPLMARAFRTAIDAGRLAYLSGRSEKERLSNQS